MRKDVPLPDENRALDVDALLARTGWIRGLARGLLRDDAVVDDVVQDTLLVSLEKPPRSERAIGA